MRNDPTFTELQSIKKEILQFKEKELSMLSVDERNDIAYIVKKIIFYKYIINQHSDDYRINALLSDYIYLVDCVLTKNVRYFYLNVRSTIEHTLRIFNNVDSENTISNFELMNKTKEELKYINNHTVNLELITAEYSKSCSYVHGNINARMPIITSFADCLSEAKKFSNIKSSLRQFCRLTEELLKLFFYKNQILIDSAFHRRKTILEYLTSQKFVSFIKD